MRLHPHGRTAPIPSPFPIFLRAAIVTVVLPFLSPSVPAAGQDHHHHPAGDADKLGSVEFSVSCSPSVAPRFERAVAMLHSFWFEASEAAFGELVAEEPGCAMAHWGRAVTLMANPMARAARPAAALREGLAAAERARELAGSATHREQMYADAAVAFFMDPDGRSHGQRMEALERAFEALHRAHPEDLEAAIFYARTLVANAPPDDQTFSRQLKAAEILEPLFEAHPDHPGLAHYLIHAYDAPPIAERGRDAAFAYASIAPSAPHALHMPSHIFTRLGYWDESIETNARSAQAEPDPDAAVHPMDYMVYAYLQQGRDAEAKAVVDRAIELPDRFYDGLLGYNFVAMPARYALERGAWADAVELRVPEGALPYIEAVSRFARAVGAARSGAPDRAQADVEALAGLKAALDSRGDGEWATRVEAQHLAAAAWVAFARGDRDEALELAARAADIDESVEKSPVTPGPILPARELQGDMLMELGRHAEAAAAYAKTLEREPRRARSLYGAARAAELAGDRLAASARYRELLTVMEQADATRAEPRAARRFLDG
jgi:tetratricopeptide (TPR) repeat protein